MAVPAVSTFLQAIDQADPGTTGHMLSGVSRGSLRSIVATGTFFCTAMATASLKNGPILASSRSLEWTLQSSDKNLILAQALPLAVYVLGRQVYPLDDVSPCQN